MILEKNNPVLFLAPGAGLGHIVRVSAIALELEKKNIPCTIITTSKWSEALKRITGIATIFLPVEQWSNEISACINRCQPSIVIQDTFPFGFRKENLEPVAEKFPFIYLARYLKTEAYFKAVNKQWDSLSPLVRNIIEIEPLSKEHSSYITETATNHYKLEGRIRFPFKLMEQPVPPELKKQLDSKRLHLVVHSGPYHEAEKIVTYAKSYIKKENDELAVISPAFVRRNMKNAHDYFPASVLFSYAFRIYTGGGYNSVAEGELYRDKLTLIPFHRSYDDQKARVEIFESDRQSVSKESGAKKIAEIIFSFLEPGKKTNCPDIFKYPGKNKVT